VVAVGSAACEKKKGGKVTKKVTTKEIKQTKGNKTKKKRKNEEKKLHTQFPMIVATVDACGLMFLLFCR
jgi:hypothetical protein